MSRKLYIFCIGGTGSRVIKNLAMLLASGVQLKGEFDTVVPVIIDPDSSNGDVNRTKHILRLYQEIRNQVQDPDDFFKQEIKTINELATNSPVISPDYFQFKLKEVDNNTFSEFIGFDSLSEDYAMAADDKSFLRMLYSEKNLKSDLSVGFKGNPNMGSIVLNQFINSDDFEKFGQTFAPDDAIFIINSIFGGTGAAGFPLLLKNLRGNAKLSGHAQIKDAPIGGITYLPYFTLDKQDEINAKSFEEKAKIAIDYYNRTIINQRHINVLHFIGNRGNTNVEKYSVGGGEQKNKAHFLEMAGALAIVNFCKGIASYRCANGKAIESTVIKEFGIERDHDSLTFDALNLNDKLVLQKPLSKFRLYTEYLKFGLPRAINISRWTKRNFFVVNKDKKSPCDQVYFESAEYKNQIVPFNEYFTEWINELSLNKPAFEPFLNVTPSPVYKYIDIRNCQLIDNMKFRSKDKKHSTLIKLFGHSTGVVYSRLPVHTGVGESRIKVFRLHEGADNTGWFNSRALTKDDLSTIKTDATEIATSIPSPFARIDLVKSAFDWIKSQVEAVVGANKSLSEASREELIKIKGIVEGTTGQHKLISDVLDVAQLFYKSQSIKDEVEIVEWHPLQRFSYLKQLSESRKHARLAETISLFWTQDSVSEESQGDLVLYNFERAGKLYFAINKNNQQVIGGTSPATLFFASPDVREAANGLQVVCGDNTLFDKSCCPLHKREVSFIEYLYSFAKQQAKFSLYFPEVYSYLEIVRMYLLSDRIAKSVTNKDATSIHDYEACLVRGNKNNICSVLGFRLGVQRIKERDIQNDSDFVIKSDFERFDEVWDGNAYQNSLQLPGGVEIIHRPLVLPIDKFVSEWTYTTKGIRWHEDTVVPAKNIHPGGESVLPKQGGRYDWLTAGNLLEDKLIELPYSIDPVKFRTSKSGKILLPLTATFFKYFSAENIDRYLKFDERAGGGVECILEIPVKSGHITYKKLYHKDDIIPLNLHLAIMPFMKTSRVELDYTIGLIDDRLDRTAEIDIKCYEKGQRTALLDAITRSPGDDQEVKSLYYKTSSPFDAISITAGPVTGFVVPVLKQYNGGTSVEFAIDFGTTNTHIEYKIGSNVPVSFDNSDQVPLWQSLINRKDKSLDPQVLVNEHTFENEMVPYSFSEKDSQLKFPVRSALVYNENTDFSNGLDVFRSINNYLLFEKRNIPRHLKLNTELKWINYEDSKHEKQVRAYIEYLLKLVLYKTLLLGGNPEYTKIIWFYPVSMDGAENSDGELGRLIKAWEELYKKVFKLANTNNLIRVPESLPPYLFYKAQVNGLSLSIDIGGGSSDIAVFDERSANAMIISSFKFAGNAIFGDGFPSNEHKSNSDRNGFVKTFLEEARTAVASDEQKLNILNYIINDKKNSSDFSSFLFSLEHNEARPFNYSQLFERNSRMKLPFFIFYGAIAYYAANLLKRSDIGIPKHLLLSGTASKTAAILDTSSAFSNLSGMFGFIFAKVHGTAPEAPIKVVLSSIPKAVTCKGALTRAVSESVSKNTIKFWIGGLQHGQWGAAIDKEKDIQHTPKYRDLDAGALAELKDGIIRFYEIMDEYVKSINLDTRYLIDSDAYEVFKRIRNDDIGDLLIKGTKAFYKNENRHIEETLFFYPLIGILNNVAFELSMQ